MDKPAFFCLVISSIITSALCQDGNMGDGTLALQTYAGQNLTLPCNSNTSGYLLDSVVWMKQSERATTMIARRQNNVSTDLSTRGYAFIEREDLLVPFVTSFDSGIYTCQIQSPFGDIIANTSLSVLVNASTFQTYSGDDFTLTCSDLTNLEDDDTLHWKYITPDLMKTIVVKNNGRTTTWGDRGFSIINRVDLFIPKTIQEDSATYECQITKASMVKVYKNTMYLEVKDVCALPVQSRELVRTTKGCHDSFIVEGERCSFFCKEGFQLDNDINVTCLPSGQLSSPLPICLNVNCSVGKLPSNLIPKTELCLPNADVPYGTNCFFECRDGYQLVKGEFIRICQANATLSGNYGKCQKHMKASLSATTVILILFVTLFFIMLIIMLYHRFKSKI